MKKFTLLLIITFYVTFGITQTPIYLNFVSHNETSDPYDYVNSSSDYWLVTNIAKEIADTIISKQAKWNVQVDGNYIIGNFNHDNAYINGNDFLEWVNNSSFIDVDGHNHFSASTNPYNYSDLAYMLDSAGVVFTFKEVAGTWEAPLETWTQYQSPVAGYTYTQYYYQPDYLWGGGTPNHSNDINDFGVWKPAGATDELEFRTHNPSNHLTYIGGGCKDKVEFAIDSQTGLQKLSTNEIIDNIVQMSNYINNLSSNPNQFFTLNILINFRDFPVIPSFADSISAIIDGVQPLVDNGKLIWLTLGEKYNLWNSQHPNLVDHFNYECDSISFLSVSSETMLKEQIKVFPNPVNSVINISSPSDIVLV